MAADGGRQYAQILKSIWADTDWRSLTRDAQWLYQLLLSQSSMNYAGVLPITVRRWSNLAADATVSVVENALVELDAKRFLVVDWDTEEALIRTFIRNDGLWKQPNMLTTAIRHASDTASDRLRWALHDELLRIPAHGQRGTLEKEASALVGGCAARDDVSHSGTHPASHSATPSEGIPASGGVGGYLSTEGDSPSTFQLPTPAAAQADEASHLRGESEIENASEQPSGPKVPADGWSMVRDVPGLKPMPQATKTALAIQAAQLLHAGSEDRHIRAALDLWLAKPDAGPGLLPHLVADVIKSETTPVRGSAASSHDAKVLGYLEAGRRLTGQSRPQSDAIQFNSRKELA